MEPFKCDYVPESAVVSLIMKIPSAFEAVYILRQEYIYALRNLNRYEWIAGRKKYHSSKETIALIAMIRLHFNYMDSTLATRDFLSRFMRIYGNHRSAIQARNKGINA